MNFGVGLATGVVMWACGVGDPVLWGVVAFLLNYIPIIGPLFGFILFLRFAMAQRAPSWLIPPHPYSRRRGDHADAVGAPIYAQSRAGDCFVDILVLDVGYPGRHFGGPDACDHQNHMRRGETPKRARSLP
jgi:hypothetical protein